MSETEFLEFELGIAVLWRKRHGGYKETRWGEFKKGLPGLDKISWYVEVRSQPCVSNFIFIHSAALLHRLAKTLQINDTFYNQSINNRMTAHDSSDLHHIAHRCYTSGCDNLGLRVPVPSVPTTESAVVMVHAVAYLPPSF